MIEPLGSSRGAGPASRARPGDSSGSTRRRARTARELRSGSTSSSSASTPRAGTASCSSSRGSTRPARTASSESVFTGLNPHGVPRHVVQGARRSTELAHDYLWRVHAASPRAGRSASSIARTTRTSSPCACSSSRRRRCGAAAPATSGSGSGCSSTRARRSSRCSSTSRRRSSATRLQERIDDPEKRWKFEPRDLEVRARFDDFQAA